MLLNRVIPASGRRWLWVIGLLLWGSLLSVQAQSQAVITPENAADVALISTMGRGTIEGIAVSADGKWLATVGGVGIWLYDTSDFSAEPRLLATPDYRYHVRFSPDSQWILAGISNGYYVRNIWLWHIEALDTPIEITFDRDMNTADFSPDSQWLLVGTAASRIGSTVYVFRLGETEPTYRLDGDGGDLTDFAFSPDQRLALIRSYGNTSLWNFTTGTPAAFSSGTGLIAFHPQLPHMATYDRDRRLRVWDMTDLENITPVAAPRVRMDSGREIIYSHDGHWLVTGGKDGVRIWDTADYSVTAHIPDIELKSDYFLDSLIFSPDDRWLVITTDERIYVWDTTTQEITYEIGEAEYDVDRVVFTADGTHLATYLRHYNREQERYEVVVEMRQIEDGAVIASHTDNIPSTTFYFGAGGTNDIWLAGWLRSEMKLWRLSDFEVLMESPGHSSVITSLAFSSDGQTLFSGSFFQARRWEVATGAETGIYPMSGSGIIQVAIDEQDNPFLSGTEGIFQLTEDAVVLLEAIVSPDSNFNLVFSPEGRFAAVRENQNDRIVVWDIAAQEEISTLDVDYGLVDFNADSTLLATVQSATLAVYDIETKELVSEIIRGYPEHYGLVFAFTPDPDIALYYNPANQLALWDVTANQEIRALNLPDATHIAELGIHPDGTILAAGYTTGEILLWDMVANKPLLDIGKQHNSGIAYLTFSPDGALLASGGGDGVIKVWGIPR